MRRPAFMLMVSVKEPSLKHRIMVPVPLALAESTAFCAKMAHRFGWVKSEKARKTMDQFLPALPPILKELRKAGPMTLVEVMEESGTHVKVSLI